MVRRVSVMKIGGSILSGSTAFQKVARFIASRRRFRPDERLIVVVSAENGATDALLATARGVVSEPDPATMDLLWSTGETRSAAMLTLHLQAVGVRAAAANVHQTGLVHADTDATPHHPLIRPLRLRALLDATDVVVAPGFLARGAGDRVVSLGRGGSDLTAVLLAAGLDAEVCELVKDVPGYFTSDPKRDPNARPVPGLSYAQAIRMADAGCALVQRQALVAARDFNLPLLIRSLDARETTTVTGDEHGIRHENHSRCSAL